ncbi:MAG TPA: hypothetical protein PKE29_17665, partial [Phycisphaerales bacterium]|nr:hypothetical protein [Phycisphaerales bacterium]
MERRNNWRFEQGIIGEHGFGLKPHGPDGCRKPATIGRQTLPRVVFPWDLFWDAGGIRAIALSIRDGEEAQKVPV